ncbi:glycerol kinase, partial [bacterium]|nr:glycerol kinase [bacterium]
MKKLILAIDAGTTGSRVLAFNKNGKIKASAYYEIPQIYPKPAWVEHNPYDLFDTVKKALNDVIEKVGIHNIDSIGITNQRETTVLWHKKTGQPVHNAIVWQCRRTTSLCQKLKPYAQIIKEKTGLFLDPYFSASKIQWILENTPNLKAEIKKGNILFGTVDTWLLWNLTGGKAHKSEPSNASRTMLYNIHKNAFDPELLKIFNIPSNILPEIQESASVFGMLDKKLFGQEIPITGILGDQQASLFGQGSLWKKNIIKNTYGTGLFLMATTKNKTSLSQNLITTIAWQINGKLTYALEGSVFTGGAAIQWLRDGLKIIKNAQETEKLARSLDSNEGVYFIPALSGLGAPY